jgi:hypothetical protein
MRTTIRLSDHLLQEAKAHAVQSGKTLTAVIEDALRESLARQNARRPVRPLVKLTTVAGQGLQPGVDLDDSAALLHLMEQADDLA